MLFIIWLAALLLIGISLLTYNQADNSWLNDPTGYEKITNSIGPVGARISSLLFDLFGYCAYGFILLLLYIGYALLWKDFSWRKIDFTTVALRLIGFNLLMFSACALVAGSTVFAGQEFNSGGHLGYLIFEHAKSYLSYTGTVVGMLAMFVLGFWLFTDLSFGAICIFIGGVVLSVFDIKNTIKNIRAWFNNEPTETQNAEQVVADKEEDSGISIVTIPTETEEFTETTRVSSERESLKESVDGLKTTIAKDNDQKIVDSQEKNANTSSNESAFVTNNQVADYTRPNFQTTAEDLNLTIPGLGKADPDAIEKPQESKVSEKEETTRVEPSVNFDELDNTITEPEEKRAPIEEPKEYVHTRTNILPPHNTNHLNLEVPNGHNPSSVTSSNGQDSRETVNLNNNQVSTSQSTSADSPVENAKTTLASETSVSSNVEPNVNKAPIYANTNVLPPHESNKDQEQPVTNVQTQNMSVSQNSPLEKKDKQASDEQVYKHARTNILPSQSSLNEEKVREDANASAGEHQAEQPVNKETEKVYESDVTEEIPGLSFTSVQEDDNSNIINFKDLQEKKEDVGYLPDGFSPMPDDILGEKELIDSKKDANEGRGQLTSDEPAKSSIIMDSSDNYSDDNAIRSSIEASTSNNTRIQPSQGQSTNNNPNQSPSTRILPPPQREVKFVKDTDLPTSINYREGYYEVNPEGPFPSTSIFKLGNTVSESSREDLDTMAERLDRVLREYRIKAHVAKKPKRDAMGNEIVDSNGRPEMQYQYECGPLITRYLLELEPGQTSSKISGFVTDISRSLCAAGMVMIQEQISGTSYVGVDVPNSKFQTISMRELLESDEFVHAKGNLPICIGRTVAGKPFIYDLSKAPHLLIAGTTGSGKSVGINTILVSLMMKNTPAELRIILVDPKQVEFSVYHDVPHLLTPVITDMKKALSALKWACEEMERRYKLLSCFDTRKIDDFNDKVSAWNANGQPRKDPTWNPNDSMATEAPYLQPLPFIFIVVDEFADIMLSMKKQKNEIENVISRLTAKARAVGIHLLLATQSPRKECITGTIKANLPSQIAFKVKDFHESQLVIGVKGAESLLGRGDMLARLNGDNLGMRRLHGAFVSDDEINMFTESWRARGKPEYVADVTERFVEVDGNNPEASAEAAAIENDKLYNDLVDFCRELKQQNKGVSISLIQRQFSIGYNRAAKYVAALEQNGLVSPATGGSGTREILLD